MKTNMELTLEELYLLKAALRGIDRGIFKDLKEEGYVNLFNRIEEKVDELEEYNLEKEEYRREKYRLEQEEYEQEKGPEEAVEDC